MFAAQHKLKLQRYRRETAIIGNIDIVDEAESAKPSSNGLGAGVTVCSEASSDDDFDIDWIPMHAQRSIGAIGSAFQLIPQLSDSENVNLDEDTRSLTTPLPRRCDF